MSHSMFFTQVQNLRKGDHAVFFSSRRGLEIKDTPRLMPGNPPQIVFQASVLMAGNEWQDKEVHTPLDTFVLVVNRDENSGPETLEQMARRAGLLGGIPSLAGLAR